MKTHSPRPTNGRTTLGAGGILPAGLFFLLALTSAAPAAWGQNQFPEKRLFSLGRQATDVGFGDVLATSGSLLAAGSPKESANVGTNPIIPVPAAGSVSIFNSKTGQFLRKLRAPNLGANGNFGASVALHGNLLAVGEPGFDRVYLFDASRGRLLRTIDGPVGTNFGAAVALHGDRLAVGLPVFNAGSGEGDRVRVFETGTGNQLAELELPIVSQGFFIGPLAQEFGAAVSMSADWILVGDPGA
ncbi:MAG: hypothetical protein KDM64_16980, partial [Verrucomicrobiae bacterium]|nr:hypothetical protein [Verrucomicrobiae bacterium]